MKKDLVSADRAKAAAAAPSAPDLAAEFLDRRTPLARVRNLLHRYPALSPGIVLVVAVVVFGIISPRFFFVNNLSLITQQVAVVGTLAIGQTLIILTAGIDLSVGAIMVLASMVVAQTASHNHVPAVLSLLLGLLVGLGAGAVNGLLVTRLKLPPFIVTLGTLNIFIALTLLYSNSASVIGQDIPALITATGATFPVFGVGVTYGVVLMLVLYVIMAFVLGRTAWGKHVYAVGDDKEAARLTGISVNRVLVFGIRLVLAGTVVLMEGRHAPDIGLYIPVRVGVWGALRRSWQLVKGKFWRVFGILLFGGLVVQIIGYALQFGITALVLTLGSWADSSGATVVAVVVSVAVGILTLMTLIASLAFMSAVQALIYLDLRVRREGLDLWMRPALRVEETA